ncbi:MULTISPECIES: TetR/AcrR family transcriptional regulator [Pelosinus]|uniref:Regulatory protein TetR n=1 Tax=Pelosinus fermentans B4 TaxID=1149862 RepID=I8RIA5_9FIRM|nr:MULTISPECIES: TetR/AcrR family transcriptional regulator [Pelosinus]EIW17745.1 regulatory protein TetR [Pelosinus fermentans B4]EIW23707.1 transcriptional regulator, TetR family [Pelosinus fermentans A11]OAM94631.1 transcriptional regulator, TetR family [Pelosinus fermentans DSM 17108]SDR14048.1 DNA-binding transcriptional regulator, AcrR family [Pelosinus fermentans]
MNKTLGAPQLSKDEIIRRRILESARMLFIEQGVESVNMHQIAKMAEVGQASLYRRYTEKGDICMDIVLEECQPLFDEVKEYLDQSAQIPILDRLYQVIIKFVTFTEAKVPWLCSVSRATPGYRPLQSPLYQSMRNTCRELLNEAVERGEVAEVDVFYTVEVLLAALHNIDFHIRDQGFSTKQILLGLHRIFIEGLKKQN